jgi:hypothetical protein
MVKAGWSFSSRSRYTLDDDDDEATAFLLQKKERFWFGVWIDIIVAYEIRMSFRKERCDLRQEQKRRRSLDSGKRFLDWDFSNASGHYKIIYLVELRNCLGCVLA